MGNLQHYKYPGAALLAQAFQEAVDHHGDHMVAMFTAVHTVMVLYEVNPEMVREMRHDLERMLGDMLKVPAEFIEQKTVSEAKAQFRDD